MSPKLIDLTGQRFGRLLVICRSGTQKTPNGTVRPVWKCECDCGVSVEVQGPNLRNGNTKSCGCYQAESMAAANRTHGMTGSPEHQSWRSMWERCTNTQNSHYHRYGGIGITVHESWRSFEIFYRDMGPRPAGMTLDRHPNPKGNYGPGNCRWATPKQQSRNTSRNIYLTWNGRTMCREDWARELGITSVDLKIRLKRWPMEKAMASPRLNRGRSISN